MLMLCRFSKHVLMHLAEPLLRCHLGSNCSSGVAPNMTLAKHQPQHRNSDEKQRALLTPPALRA